MAALRPEPPVPASVRRLPTTRPAPVAAPPPLVQAAMVGQPVPPSAAASPPAPTPPGPAPAPAPVQPARPPAIALLAPERYRVQFTASAETYAKLQLAQDLLRHQIPDADLGQVLDRALTVLVDALLKEKVAATDRPRPGRRLAPGSRHVPAAVRRAVWARDGRRCAFVSPTGRRCTARGGLEFHHVRPYAAGGPATVENIELRCRAHNRYEAEQVFGHWGPSQVREPASVYANGRRASSPTPTRFEPSWTSAGRPP